MADPEEAPKTQAKAPNDVTKSSKRAARLEKQKKSGTRNFAFDPGVRASLIKSAKAQGLDLSHVMQKSVEGHIIHTAPKKSELSKPLSAACRH